MQIRLADERDIGRWMDLIGKVRAQFPGLETQEAMAEHRNTVLRFMKRQSALCAEQAENLAGVLLFDREAGMLCFLAVDPACRRQQLATRLVFRMLSLMESEQEVLVTTYCEGVPEGAAARAFYKRLGFVEGNVAESFGSPVQKFVLPAGRGIF